MRYENRIQLAENALLKQQNENKLHYDWRQKSRGCSTKIAVNLETDSLLIRPSLKDDPNFRKIHLSIYKIKNLV